MTREETIEILRKNRPTSDPRPCGMELCDALDMAISALRQQDVADKDVGKNEPLTNAQKIRSMSDEELAKMLWKSGRNYRSICADQAVDYSEHYNHIIEWLQQPAEEDKHEAD